MSEKRIVISAIAVFFFCAYPAFDAYACTGGGWQEVFYIPPPEHELYFAKNIRELMSVAYPGQQWQWDGRSKYSVALKAKVKNNSVVSIAFHRISLKDDVSPIVVDFYSFVGVYFTKDKKYPNVQRETAFHKIASFKLGPEVNGELLFRIRAHGLGKPKIYVVVREYKKALGTKPIATVAESNMLDLWDVCGSSAIIVYTHNKSLHSLPLTEQKTRGYY